MESDFTKIISWNINVGGSPQNLITVVSDVLFFHTTLFYSLNIARVGSKKEFTLDEHFVLLRISSETIKTKTGWWMCNLDSP